MIRSLIATVFATFVMLGCNSPVEKSSLVIMPVGEGDKQAILSQMEASRQGWNTGDFDAYMDVYWASDSLQFMGLNSITHGWQPTLDRYKKSYPTAEHRGVLTYQFTHFNQLAEDCILVIGHFHLERPIGNAEGNFSLIWKRIKGEWRIILDHT